MKKLNSIFLALAVVVISGIAHADQELYPVEIEADLNGDGVTESILFKPFNSEGGVGFCEYLLVINGIESSHHAVFLTGLIEVVDIDSSDPFKEITISEYGPSDDPASYFFRFKKGNLFELGCIPGSLGHGPNGLVVDGTGIVTANCRGNILHTWWHPCRYQIGQYGAFEVIPATNYIMNAKLEMLQTLSLLNSPGSSDFAVELSPGESITVISTDDVQWCQVKTENGEMGWFEMTNSETLADGRNVQEVFEGLCIAD